MQQVFVFNSFGNAVEDCYGMDSLHFEVLINSYDTLLISFLSRVFYIAGKILIDGKIVEKCVIGYECIDDRMLPLHIVPSQFDRYFNVFGCMPNEIQLYDGENLREFVKSEHDWKSIRYLFDRLLVDIDTKDVDIEQLEKEAQQFGTPRIAETGKGYHIRIVPQDKVRYDEFLRWKTQIPGVDFNEIAITMRNLSLPVLFNEKIVLTSEQTNYSYEKNLENRILGEILNETVFRIPNNPKVRELLMLLGYKKLDFDTFQVFHTNDPKDIAIFDWNHDVFYTTSTRLFNLSLEF